MMEEASTSKRTPSTSKSAASIETQIQTNGTPSSASPAATKPDDRSKGQQQMKKRKRPKKKAKPPNGNEAAVPAAPTLMSIMEREVIDGLTHCQPFRLMEMLHKAIKPEPSELFHACMEVKSDLMLIFGRCFPIVHIDVFGSTIIGTAFKDSDFDFHIQLQNRYGKFPAANIVRDAIKMLAPSRKFTKFVPIPSARIPILKCLHIRTGYNCDLNFSDSLGVYNSPILGTLLQFDERIYDMAIILKYWMKVHDLSGSYKLSNYALLWLLIFYLQTLPQPIVPPIKSFQKNIQPYYINQMNLAFNQRLPNNTRNRQRQSELLLGFFEFYSTFDFETQIICPLHAKAFPKENVVERYPAEFAAYIDVMTRRPDTTGLRLNKTICIQDPFDIIQTVPGPISKQHFTELRKKLAIAVNVFKQAWNDYGESGRSLLSIFNREAFIEATPAQPKANRSSFFVKVVSIESELVLIRKYLLKNQDADTVIHAADIKMLWCKYVIEYIIDMLINVYCMKLVVNDNGTTDENNETASKSPKVDGQKDVHTNDLQKMVTVSGDKDVFYGRKQQKVLMPTFIRSEIEMSKKRYEIGQIKINFKARVKLAAAPENADFVNIDFEDLVCTRKNNYFKGFQAVFTAGVRHFLKGYFLQFQTINELGLNAEAIPTATTKRKRKPKKSTDKLIDEDADDGHTDDGHTDEGLVTCGNDSIEDANEISDGMKTVDNDHEANEKHDDNHTTPSTAKCSDLTSE